MSFVSLVSDEEGLDLIAFMNNFYFMEAIKARIPLLPQHYSSVTVALNIIEKWHEFLNETMVPIFKAYLLMAGFGEQRHALTIKLGHPNYVSPERSQCYPCALNYDPKVLQSILELVFLLPNNFGSSFGGEKWAQIVKAYTYFDSMGNIPALDHIFDLQHNGGIALNKPTSHFKVNSWSQIKSLLDKKKNVENLAAEWTMAKERVTCIYTGQEYVNKNIKIPWLAQPYSPLIPLVMNNFITGRETDINRVFPITTIKIPTLETITFGGAKPNAFIKHDAEINLKFVTACRDHGVPLYYLLERPTEVSNIQAVLVA